MKQINKHWPKKKEWSCYECGEQFKTKKALIEHLKEEFEDATNIADGVVFQLEELGITEWVD